MLQLQFLAQQYIYIYIWTFVLVTTCEHRTVSWEAEAMENCFYYQYRTKVHMNFMALSVLILLYPTLQNGLRSFSFFPRLYTKISNYFKAQMRDAVKYKFQGNLLRFQNPVSLRQCELWSIRKYLRRSCFEKFKKHIQFSVVSN